MPAPTSLHLLPRPADLLESEIDPLTVARETQQLLASVCSWIWVFELEVKTIQTLSRADKRTASAQAIHRMRDLGRDLSALRDALERADLLGAGDSAPAWLALEDAEESFRGSCRALGFVRLQEAA